METIILSNGTMIDYEISTNGDTCKIIDSYLIKSKKEKYEFIRFLLRKYQQFSVRSIRSYYREWKSHNVLYKLHFIRKSTKDTDLCTTEYWWRRVGYFFISIFSIDF